MFSFLASHFLLSGTVGVALLVFVAVGLLGGWSLVLNRYGLGVLAAIFAMVGLAFGYEALADRLRAEGKAEVVATNQRAQNERRAAITAWAVDKAARDVAAFDKQRLAEQRMDLERDQWKKDSHVSKAADAACGVPDGFVFDHDRAAPRTPGRPALQLAVPANSDRRSGIPLSIASNAIVDNYSACRKLIDRVETTERKRYDDCVAYDKRYGTTSGCSP